MKKSNNIINILCIDNEKHYKDWNRIISYDNSRKYIFTNELDGENVLGAISEMSIKIALIDKNLGADKKNGIEVAKELRNNYSDIFNVLVTSYGKNAFGEKTDEILDALQTGIIDYYVDKNDVAKELGNVIDIAIDSLNNSKKRKEYTEAKIQTLKLMQNFKVDESSDDTISKELIGNSKSIQDIKKWIVKYSLTKDPVLILGETGTGKDVVANLIHKLSNRTGNIVPVNCGAIPSELIESELFGHVKGAFTGAITDKKGKFEMAVKGTLFLDEIGDLPMSAQTKFLRAIQNEKISKVGETKETNIDDVRIICATNQQILSKINKNEFRADLYYRICGFPLQLLPLRERKSDIPLLVERFKENKNFTDAAIEEIQKNDWYGNVRELKSFIENLIHLFPEINTFDVDAVKDALTFWKGMHPETNYLFNENENKTTGDLYIFKNNDVDSVNFSLERKKEIIERLDIYLLAADKCKINNEKISATNMIKYLLIISNEIESKLFTNGSISTKNSNTIGQFIKNNKSIIDIIKKEYPGKYQILDNLLTNKKENKTNK